MRFWTDSYAARTHYTIKTLQCLLNIAIKWVGIRSVLKLVSLSTIRSSKQTLKTLWYQSAEKSVVSVRLADHRESRLNTHIDSGIVSVSFVFSINTSVQTRIYIVPSRNRVVFELSCFRRRASILCVLRRYLEKRSVHNTLKNKQKYLRVCMLPYSRVSISRSLRIWNLFERTKPNFETKNRNKSFVHMSELWCLFGMFVTTL